MKIKQGVTMQGLQMEMRHVLKVADSVYKSHGQELVVTSATDGTHSAGSFHYYGYALDFRTRFFTNTKAKQVAHEIRIKLSDGYFVLFEGNHIHVQFNASL